ncbi:EAL domain-containing protein [Anaerostipes sp.]|uniref:EAL domain-containing protein n=1 Tax=Anaerostipes sp. TaxID=1872530 RepID=UPI0025BE4E10|nr:EAL domain-containing protein [Anaerostipes sp.]MBS7009364.1 EAL domain-containing protein [Anaerostipes sp.]
MLSQKKVLVVEDNQMNRQLLCEILASDYDVLEAENGKEALEVLKQYGEGISLILLDIVMPVMDGYTFLSVMKADKAYSSIPVIVTTQNDAESDELSALSHGAADFVAKPYRPQIILHRAAGIINLRETAAVVNQVKFDRLTGLYSKEFFYQLIRDALMRNPEGQYDIICSDIENFKLVNDVFGAPAGDHLLCGVARMYKEGIDGNGVCGRLNADQFVCMIEHRRDYSDEMFQKVNEKVNELMEAGSIAMKWGIYTVEDRELSVEQMCDRALLAARSIKGQYGKYFAFYDDKLRSRLLHDQAITDSMEEALEENQFQVYLQPKYRIMDGSLAGAEALVRWDHPEWGLQSPANFIPLFENNGFITKMDQYVWEKTCEKLREWKDKGYPAIPVSVNVSRADIYNADLPDILQRILQKYKLDPSWLHLEITESAYTETPSQIIEVVSRLRELGFVIEMDDFGSGYSSLNMLNNMPIDILKLDMKFIQSETAKPVSQGILKFIINLARWMHLSVVAEGVETKDQLERLREIGCDYVQGYYFAKPMPCTEFEKLLSKGAANSLVTEKSETVCRTGGKSILLIAEEDRVFREKIKKDLEEEYQVLDADGGDGIMDAVKEHENEIAAVVLSLTYPELDGCLMLKQMKEDRTCRNIPVIAAAEPDARTEEKALEAGADDFIGRPFFAKSLLNRIRRASDINAYHMHERVLQDEEFQDYQTGLLNRKGLKAAVKSLREEDMPLAVYLFRLNTSEQKNNIRDEQIYELGTILRTYTRRSDILGRFSGNEFLAVMKQAGSGDFIVKKGEEICTAVKDACGGGKDIICSAGAVLLEEGDTIAAAIERAGQVLNCTETEGMEGCRLWRGEIYGQTNECK